MHQVLIQIVSYTVKAVLNRFISWLQPVLKIRLLKPPLQCIPVLFQLVLNQILLYKMLQHILTPLQLMLATLLWWLLHLPPQLLWQADLTFIHNYSINVARWSGCVWVGECFFWYRPTRVVPDQRPLNGRRCCCCCHNYWYQQLEFWYQQFNTPQVLFSDINNSIILVILVMSLIRIGDINNDY